MRAVPTQALELIESFEGRVHKAYKCPAGVTTIGVGHTGQDVKMGMEFTDEEIDDRLLDDANEAAEFVLKYVKVPLTDNQYSALISFVFNIGGHNFKNSTLVKNLNNGWYAQVPIQLMRWNMAGGEVMGGLTRRRKAEAALWSQPDDIFTS